MLLALSASTLPVCQLPREAGAVVARRELRWLMLGEAGHGSNELPRAAQCLVLEAVAHGRRVLFGVEYGVRNQPWLDDYMASDGGPAARARLLSAPAWDPNWADGKSSSAVLRLLEWLRSQHRSGGVAGVVAFDVDEGRGAVRERGMAKRLRSVGGSPGILLIALTGALHAQKRDGGSDPVDYVPAAGLLPAGRTFSLRLEGDGGRNWSCRDDGCGPHDVDRSTDQASGPRWRRTADGRYDAVFGIGTPVTPSAPARK